MKLRRWIALAAATVAMLSWPYGYLMLQLAGFQGHPAMLIGAILRGALVPAALVVAGRLVTSRTAAIVVGILIIAIPAVSRGTRTIWNRGAARVPTNRPAVYDPKDSSFPTHPKPCRSGTTAIAGGLSWISAGPATASWWPSMIGTALRSASWVRGGHRCGRACRMFDPQYAGTASAS